MPEFYQSHISWCFKNPTTRESNKYLKKRFNQLASVTVFRIGQETQCFFTFIFAKLSRVLQNKQHLPPVTFGLKSLFIMSHRVYLNSWPLCEIIEQGLQLYGEFEKSQGNWRSWAIPCPQGIGPSQQRKDVDQLVSTPFTPMVSTYRKGITKFLIFFFFLHRNFYIFV